MRRRCACLSGVPSATKPRSTGRPTATTFVRPGDRVRVLDPREVYRTGTVIDTGLGPDGERWASVRLDRHAIDGTLHDFPLESLRREVE